jgi:hypothetical protein
VRTLLAVLFACLALATVSTAVAADAVKLATFSLGERTDKDVVTLPECSSSHNVKVTAIQLRVAKFPAELNRVRVVFHNGADLVLTPNVHVKAGGSSPWLDLPGDARCIAKIVVVGDTDSKKKAAVKKQAQVTVMGRAPQAAQEVRAEGGTRLGVVRLSDKTDRDVVQLPRCKDSPNPRVSSLRFTVSEHPAQIDRLKVEFHNGETVELQVKDHFKAGGSSRWLDMPGDKRCVAKIIVVGDADTVRKTPKKQSQVAFFGR